MKYIKSYRVFESKGFTIPEMLELGLLDWSDLPGLIENLDETGKLELVKPLIKKYGLEKALTVVSADEVKTVYQDNPASFLDQFGNLTQVEKGGKIYYITKDKDRLPLFYYYPDEKNGSVFINYDRIWMFFQKIFGLKNSKIQDIMKNWLEETYNLRGLTPQFSHFIDIM